MNSPEQQTHNKLDKALKFFRRQADALAEKSRQFGSRVTELARLSGQLDYEMEQQELYFVTLAATPTNRMLAHRSLQQLAEQKEQNQIQLQSARNEFELNRVELMSLTAKVESIEKLMERLAGSISLETRKQEQIIADERYLNTHFVNRSLT